MTMSAEEIRLGLKNDEFVPFFQPLTVLRTGELAGFEVLARWLHPVHELVLPDEFIGAAEREGLLSEIMRKLLDKAFRVGTTLPDSLRLAINVSPLQLHDVTLSRQILDACEATGFSPERLVVEITENALANDLDTARATIMELKSHGCKIALDDFGTGYSSLLHLHSLPFDELKVDRSFVRSMVENRQSRKIVSAVVGLGHSLGLTTIAEGVETREQAEMLLSLECAVGQGWLFGSPVPVADLAEVLHTPQPRITTANLRPRLGEIFDRSLPSVRLAQLQSIYDGAPVGLALLDRNLRYININQQLADMHQVSLEAYLGKTVAEVVPNIYCRAERYLLRALAGETVAGVEFRMSVQPGQKPGRFLVSYLPVHDERNEVIGVTVAVLDVTPHKLEGRAQAVPSL
jgi:EAL domain-containing protein (putative c-di-GMP-specific phosphodiesterase class I)